MIDYSKFNLYLASETWNKFILTYKNTGWSCDYHSINSAINILLASEGWNIHHFPDTFGYHIGRLDTILDSNPEYFL